MLRSRNISGQTFLRRFAGVALALGMVGASSLSQAMELWVGVGVGQTKFDPTRLSSGLPTGSLDDKDSGWKIMFGGPMFEKFGLEFSILKLGNFTASSGGLSENSEAKGWALEGIGMFPVGKSFLLMARGGLFRHDFDTTVSTAGGNNDSVADLTYGVGVQYGTGPGVNLRLEWQRFEGLGSQRSSEGDIDMLSLGVLYQF